MRQRFVRVCFWLSVAFAAWVQDRAAAQSVNPWDGPISTANSDQPGYPIRYTLRHFAGQAPGYDTGLTRFELFIPLIEVDGSSLLFCDLQPLIDNDGNWGSNLGLGFRAYSPTFDRVFGAYGYFDYRETGYHRFQQGTIGFDTLGNWVDGRINFYVPGQELMDLPSQAAATPHFQGSSLRYGGYETAMLGGDFEVGVRVPPIAGIQSQLFAGVYWFDGNGEADVAGWKARIETCWTRNFSTDVALYDDDVFGTTVMVGLAFNIQHESYSLWKPQMHTFRRGPYRHIANRAADRVAEPTYRQPSIAIRRDSYRAAIGDSPSQMIHVVEGVSGGNGSFERPFGSLDQALAVARPGQIIYTPYGGSYQGTSPFSVPEGVSLLSNAPVQLIQTDVGWMQLPLSGASPDLSAAPVILGSVEMSSGSTLNGFRVVGTGDTLAQAGVVYMVGVSDVTVVNNAIWSRQDGIRIENAMYADVVDNRIAQALGSGIFLTGGTEVTLTRNTVDSAGRHGIEVIAGADARIADNAIASASGSGIAVTQGRRAQITENQIAAAGQHGIQVIDGSGVTVAGNQVLAAQGHGITLTDAVNASVTDNLIQSAGGHGIEFFTGTSATVAANQIGTVGGHGITLAEAANANVTGNSIASSAQDGIQVVKGAGITLSANAVRQALGNGIGLTYGANASIQSNVIDTAGLHGLNIVEGGGASIVSNQIRNALGDGIFLADGPNTLLNQNSIGAAGGNGIEVIEGGGVLLSKNDIGSAHLNGIAVARGSNATIADNKIGSVSGDAGDPASGNGIAIADGTSAAISGNTIGTIGANGIRVSNAANAALERNQITHATGNGILILAGANARVSDNVVERATQNGIDLADAYDATVVGNYLQNIGADGIRIRSGTDIEISGNQLDRTDKNGLTLLGIQRGSIANNVVGFAGLDGVHIEEGNDLEIVGNSVQRAMDNGIDITGVDFLGTVGSNSILQAQTGIQAVLGRQFSGELIQNTLTQNRVHGIYLQAGQFVDGSTISGSTIDESEAEAISILATGTEASLLDVHNNTLTLNNVFHGNQQREVITRLGSGAGFLTVDLSGNKSYNLLQPGEFNFDFLNEGGLGLLYQDDGTNLGSIGSSDGSVPPPP